MCVALELPGRGVQHHGEAAFQPGLGATRMERAVGWAPSPRSCVLGGCRCVPWLPGRQAVQTKKEWSLGGWLPMRAVGVGLAGRVSLGVL